VSLIEKRSAEKNLVDKDAGAWRRRMIVFIPLVAFLALAALFVLRLGAGDPSRIPSALIGHSAPRTDLPPLAGLAREGKPVPGVDSADFKGQVTVLNVWASWCVPCRSESPALERFYRAHRGRDFTILGLDYQDVTGDALAFMRRYGVTYPQLRDGSGDFSSKQLGTTGVPESFLVDPRGQLVLHSLGPVTDRYLRANVVPYLSGRATQ
jgi:cytochrome c biogenesis protein CcmG/thiol:disulfide interchange protein DsbE